MRWLNGINDPMDMTLGKLWEIAGTGNPWHAVVHRVTKSRTQLNLATEQSNNRSLTMPVRRDFLDLAFVVNSVKHSCF